MKREIASNTLGFMHWKLLRMDFVLRLGCGESNSYFVKGTLDEQPDLRVIFAYHGLDEVMNLFYNPIK